MTHSTPGKAPPPAAAASTVRRVLLGVGAGIAAYKSAELVRRLRDQDCDVRVVMTARAGEFVGATTFQALSGNPVRTSLWDAEAEAAMGHIELARWADAVVIAPATADLIARLAHGLADDLLTTLVLATAAPIWLAPAMNQAMWSHAATVANVATLAQRGARFVGPGHGSQACGDVGAGRMAEPSEILDALLSTRSSQREQDGVATSSLHGLRVLITAGPTFEDIDPVRFIGNRSSGRMGFALAAAAHAVGANVTLIAGPVSLDTPPGVARIDVRSAAEMLAAVRAAIGRADIFIANAAVADYRPRAEAPDKIKKQDATRTLELVRTTDIVTEVAALPTGPLVVGFAAETRDLREHARDKLVRKRLDLIVANPVGSADSGFEVDRNEALALWLDGERAFPTMSKSALAVALVELIAERFRATRPTTP